MAKNYFYRAICTDGRGWESAGWDGVWGQDHADHSERIFSSAAEAWRLVRDTRNAGCWTYQDDDENDITDVPELDVEKCAVYEACWMDDEADADEIERIVEIHGREIEFRRMPKSVAAFLIAKFGGVSQEWSRLSASLVGASSATHTAAFASGIWRGRANQIAKMLAERTVSAPAPQRDRGL